MIFWTNALHYLFSDYLDISSVDKRFQNAEAVLGNGAEAGGEAGHPTGQGTGHAH